MDRIRFGLIGIGMAGRYFGQALQNLPDADLIAVASRPGRGQALAEFAKTYGVSDWHEHWQELVNRDDIDAICVVTPPQQHEEMVIASAQAGKHVMTEKPLAVNLLEADRMIAACDESNVKLGCIFMYRFMDTARRLKEAIALGRLGQLYLADCVAKFYRDQAYYDSADWRGSWEGEGGGSLMSQAIHTIDLMLWMMGDVVELSGYYRTAAHAIAVDDLAVANLRFKNGALGTIISATATKPGYPRRLEIHGERGSIGLLDDDVHLWDIEGQERPDWVGTGKKDLGNTFSQPGYADIGNHQEQLADFIASIRQDRPPLVDGREGRRALEVIRAIYQSQDTGKSVAFPVDDKTTFGKKTNLV